MLWIMTLTGISLALAVCVVLNQAKFGGKPEGARLQRLQASPHYADGEFRNTIPTPALAEGQSSLKIMLKGLFTKTERLRPAGPVPMVKTDLAGLAPSRDVFIWLGHSSYYIQLGGKRILVDPVFSEYASPFSFANRIFPGTGLYTADDMPEIDVLLISHDHWDHLDYPTVMALSEKVATVVVPLGVGAHFERWGYPAGKIVEADWWDVLPVNDSDCTIHVVPARHYSGRSFTRNKTLWAGFVLESNGRRIFLSGDSGYGPHIAAIGSRFNGFDLAAIDGGQFDARWPLIHMTPEEAARAAEDLQAKKLLLTHAGRFAIAAHAWDEPFTRAVAASEGRNGSLVTPQMGEPLWFDEPDQTFSHWWEGIDGAGKRPGQEK